MCAAHGDKREADENKRMERAVVVRLRQVHNSGALQCGTSSELAKKLWHD